MRQVRALDGVRGIAILAVMFFHYGYLATGWIGVQLFFTLSGYLITAGLLERRSSLFTEFIAGFYWRRALRIFPLFYGFLAVVAAIFALTGMPDSFAADRVWLLTYLANFARMRDADLGPAFVHLWSLALEEQFYLIWPFLVFFLPERAFRAVVAATIILMPVVRLALFQWLLGTGHAADYAGKAVYVLPFTQLDSFATGAAIPLWNLDKMRNARSHFIVAVGVAAIGGMAVLVRDYVDGSGAFVASLGYAMYLTHGIGYVWGYSLLNVVSMLAIICALQPGRFSKALERAPLVSLGRVSYGVYVYHLPLLVLCTYLIERVDLSVTWWAALLFFPVWFFLVLLVSQISFRWLEAPFLALKRVRPIARRVRSTERRAD